MVLFQCVSGWICRTYLVKNSYTSGNPWFLSLSTFVLSINPCSLSAILSSFRILLSSANRWRTFNLVSSHIKHSSNHTSQSKSYSGICSSGHCSCSPSCLHISSVSMALSNFPKYHPFRSPLAVTDCASTSTTSYHFYLACISAIRPWGICTLEIRKLGQRYLCFRRSFSPHLTIACSSSSFKSNQNSRWEASSHPNVWHISHLPSNVPSFASKHHTGKK